MRSKITVLLILSCYFAFSEASEQSVEGRGKKKKIALFVYLADLVIKKFFILKLAFAFVLWALIHKAGYFFTWFINSLKEKKPEYHHDYHDHYEHHPHYDHGHHGFDSYGPPSYGPPQFSNGPYKRQAVET